MNRPSLQRHFSTLSVVLFAILLMATVACAGGGDDVAPADKGGETATETGNGTPDTPATPAGGGDKAPDSTCAGNNVKIVNVTLKEQGASGKWKISVDKETVEITTKGRVCWETSGLQDGYTLTMSGKTGTDSQFPTRSVTPPPTTINSGAPNGTGTFQYDLILTHGDEEVGKLDPRIIINPGG